MRSSVYAVSHSNINSYRGIICVIPTDLINLSHTLVITSENIRSIVFFFYGSTVVADLGLLCEVSRPHSVGLLWTIDQPVPKTSTWQKEHLKETGISVPSRTRTRSLTQWAAVNPRLRGRGSWVREILYYST
jgi:hypothetical protein